MQLTFPSRGEIGDKVKEERNWCTERVQKRARPVYIPIVILRARDAQFAAKGTAQVDGRERLAWPCLKGIPACPEHVFHDVSSPSADQASACRATFITLPSQTSHRHTPPTLSISTSALLHVSLRWLQLRAQVDKDIGRLALLFHHLLRLPRASAFDKVLPPPC